MLVARSDPVPYRRAYNYSRGCLICEVCGVELVEGEPVIYRKKNRVYHEDCFYAVPR